MKKIFAALAILVSSFSALANTADNVSLVTASGTETDECVLAHSTDTYEVTFRAGREATVLVVGDGDTDLDLYIYVENGNLLDSDTDNLDTMVCSWTPRWTGTFTIKIKNLGSVRNYYTMWTN